MSENTTSSGIGFWGLLTIVFIVLKLTNIISWSWWWILLPIWGPAFIIITISIGMLLLGASITYPGRKR